MKIFTNKFLFGVFGLTAVMSATQAEENLTMEKLLEMSKPAPNPQGSQYSRSQTNAENQRLEVGYDMETKTETIYPFRPKNNPQPDKFKKGSIEVADSLIDAEHDNVVWRGGATPPTQHLNTTSFPWNTIYKLVMRFNVDGTDYFYNCSAWSAGNFHLVTAGHCVYNYDPNGDDDTSDQKWADEVWVYAGQTDRVSPFECGNQYCADLPYGWARSRYIRSYSGWTVNQNHNHDFAVITLDRNAGQRTGWMGRSSDVSAGDSVNFSGYPTETPHVPAGINVQYKGFDSGNVVSTTDYRIELSAFVYGGHSGGPSWRYTNGERYVVGIHSTSNRTGTAHDTLLTTGKRDDINAWMTTDETARPPLVRGDLTESLFDGNPHKSISKTLVGKEEDLTVNFQILNAGYADITNNIFVDFYASTNQLISTSDYWLGSGVISSDISDWSFMSVSRDITIPSSLPAGGYTVGWLMSTTGEYANDQDCGGTPCTNVVAIADQSLVVENCTSDAYEDDNTSATGFQLYNNSSQSHSICSTGDVDWFRITVPSGSGAYEVITETSGSSGDTVISLYNSNLTLIENDDDSGAGRFSKIDRKCGENALNPGTYYLQVFEYQNNHTIENYQVSMSQVACSDLIFRHGFEN